jgi:hypothetical protein
LPTASVLLLPFISLFFLLPFSFCPFPFPIVLVSALPVRHFSSGGDAIRRPGKRCQAAAHKTKKPGRFLCQAFRFGSDYKDQELVLPNMVGAAGFELATPCTPCKCATRLRYAPKKKSIAELFGVLQLINNNSIKNCLHRS